jgi:hypothetical protein
MLCPGMPVHYCCWHLAQHIEVVDMVMTEAYVNDEMISAY